MLDNTGKPSAKGEELVAESSGYQTHTWEYVTYTYCPKASKSVTAHYIGYDSLM